MDFTGFYEFPFPSVLSEDDERVKKFFYALSDERQLSLLNGSKSYQNFHDRVVSFMDESAAAL